MKRQISLSLLLVVVLGACATSPTGRGQLLLISPEAAVVESQKAYVAAVQQLEKEDKLLDDPRLAERVALVTGRLVAETVALHPHTARWKWSVVLIDAPETVNAWCMAGGRMAVYSGLFEKLDLDDDEFAQIMGHEISHAVANHTAERMSMVLAQSVGLIALGATTDNEGVLTGAALAAQLAVQLPNSRVAESEADRLGIELASRAGYAPAAAVTLWRKMEENSDSQSLEFLSTHPSPANRRASLAALVPAMRKLKPVALRKPYPVEILP